MLPALAGPQLPSIGIAVVEPADADSNQMEMVQKLIATQMLYLLLQVEINMELNSTEVLLFHKHLVEETGLLVDVENAGKLVDQMERLLY